MHLYFPVCNNLLQWNLSVLVNVHCWSPFVMHHENAASTVRLTSNGINCYTLMSYWIMCFFCQRAIVWMIPLTLVSYLSGSYIWLSCICSAFHLLDLMDAYNLISNCIFRVRLHCFWLILYSNIWIITHENFVAYSSSSQPTKLLLKRVSYDVFLG